MHVVLLHVFMHLLLYNVLTVRYIFCIYCSLIARIIIWQFVGSRRPSLASLHSRSSVRSYSHRRYERELEQKEARQEMKKHLARIQATNNFNNNNNNNHNLTGRREGYTPSPRSPNSTDELLPTIADDSSDVRLSCIQF